MKVFQWPSISLEKCPGASGNGKGIPGIRKGFDGHYKGSKLKVYLFFFRFFIQVGRYSDTPTHIFENI